MLSGRYDAGASYLKGLRLDKIGYPRSRPKRDSLRDSRLVLEIELTDNIEGAPARCQLCVILGSLLSEVNICSHSPNSTAIPASVYSPIRSRNRAEHWSMYSSDLRTFERNRHG